MSNLKTKPIISKQENIYYSVTGFPFDKFLDFYCDGNYQALLKHGQADILHLVIAGEQIRSQFFDITTGMDDATGVKEAIKLEILQSRVDRIQAIVDSLAIRYNEELAGLLQGLGIRRTVSRETLTEDLKGVVKEARKYILEIEQLTNFLKLKNKGDKKPTRETFENILSEIDPSLMADKIDTFRFGVLYRKLKAKQKDGAGKNK